MKGFHAPLRGLTLVALSALLAALTASPASAGTNAAAPCGARVDRGVLPVWARAGFSDPRPRIAHVLGRSGEIAAILFGPALRSPAAKAYNNKILWVARSDPKSWSVLRIRAQRMSGARLLGRPVSRSVAGGPGPSIIDLPAAGCWRMTLTWSGRTDSLDLRYAAHG